MCEGIKSQHTDVLRSACAGDVETIIYSRLESIFSIVVCIRSDGTWDVLDEIVAARQITSHDMQI